jgi:hypothetical protein
MTPKWQQRRKTQTVPNDEQVILRAGIERFARTISAQPLGLAKYAPEPGADIRLCFENARGKAEQSGGEVRFGWMFQHKLVQQIPGPGYLIGIHHAVWRGPNGYLFDVTPLHPEPQHHPLAVRGDTLFLVDDLAQPVRSGRLLGPRPIKFFALDEDAQLVSHVERLRAKEEQHCRDLYAAGEA